MTLIDQNGIDQKVLECEKLMNSVANSAIGFGQIMGPVMASIFYRDGKWQELEILPYGPISMYPNAKVLHYAQEIFEGMKAYQLEGKNTFLFRTDENFLRFNRSAERMAMPHIPYEIFNEAIHKTVSLSKSIIPKRSGESLYLRPFMFATEETLGIKPSSEYRFMVITSPSGSYFQNDSLSVLIERKCARAFPGGTGFAKAGGNYAASLLSAIKAKHLNIGQTLWLDGLEFNYIEEMSGMNIFFVINQELHTPQLTDTILDGITRKSIIQLAKYLGIKVIERKIPISEILAGIKAGSVTEGFACGTAAILSGIDYLAEESGERYPFVSKDGAITQKLREELLSIQEGRKADPFKWCEKVN